MSQALKRDASSVLTALCEGSEKASRVYVLLLNMPSYF